MGSFVEERERTRPFAEAAVLLPGTFSPELVLVLPEDERMAAIQALPPIIDSFEERPVRSPAPSGEHLSKGRLLLAAACYALSCILAALPFFAVVVGGTFLVTLLVSAIG